MEWQQVLWALVTLVGIAACWDASVRRMWRAADRRATRQDLAAHIARIEGAEARLSAVEAYQGANTSVLVRVEERLVALEMKASAISGDVSACYKETTRNTALLADHVSSLAINQAAMAETLKQHEKAILDAKNTASKQVQNRWRS